MSSMSDLKKYEQASKKATLHDVVWKMQELIPESPKKDGSAEAYLFKIGKTPAEYVCTTLVVTTKNMCNKCSVCQEDKITKLCRLIKNDTFNDIFICTDCVNVFAEYNPKSVFDLEPKETK